MNAEPSKPRAAWWEYVVYVLVTVPLLAVGLVLWLGGLVLRLVVLIKKRK